MSDSTQTPVVTAPSPLEVQGTTKATAMLDAFFSEQPVAPDAVVETPAVQAQPATTADPAKPAETSTQKPGLADAIRTNRLARQGATESQQANAAHKAEVEALKAEISKLQLVTGTKDPYQFLRSSGLSKDEQAIWGQAFLYDLKPEVAPKDFGLEMYKHQQAKEKEAERKAQEEAQTRQLQEQAQQQLHQYSDSLISTVLSTPGSAPESEAWFSSEDGSVDKRALSQSLLATAENLARAAQAQGQVADLSPANVVRALEQEVAKRMARRDAKRGSKAAVPPQQKPQASDKQVAETMSESGLRSGPPAKPDFSDKARFQRAIAAGWGDK